MFFYKPCTPPKKPKNVPEQAIWSGGCDGGEWIELVEIKESKYHFRIYQDWNGKLQMDADFRFKNRKTILTSDNWKEIVCCYSHSIDSLVTLSVVKKEGRNTEYYLLKSIYPAYGGEDWKIIKERYKLR